MMVYLTDVFTCHQKSPRSALTDVTADNERQANPKGSTLNNKCKRGAAGLHPEQRKGILLISSWLAFLVSRMVFGYYWASACLALFIAFLALDIMGLFSRKNYLDVDGKVWHAGVRDKNNV